MLNILLSLQTKQMEKYIQYCICEETLEGALYRGLQIYYILW